MSQKHDRNGNASPEIKESRLNRRVAIVAIVASLASAYGAAWITAHSAPVIRILGSRTIIKQINAGARDTGQPGAGGGSSAGGSSAGGSSGGTQGAGSLALPGGAAFTKRAFTIGGNGIDLDRNPPEQGNLTSGQIEMQFDSPETLDFQDTQEVFSWTQPGLPTQAQCHSAELRNGQQDPNVDLTNIQQTHSVGKFCILTSEGRDAFVEISGTQVRPGQDVPAEAIVWSTLIPIQ
jgi:hypothetical protein